MEKLGRFVLQTIGVIGAEFAMVIVAGFIAPQNRTLATVFLAVLAAVAGYSTFKPLFQSRFFGPIGTGFVAVTAGLSAVGFYTAPLDAASLSALRGTNPSQYLVEIHKTDPDLWMKELAVLDPPQFAVEKDKQAQGAALAAKEAEAKSAEASKLALDEAAKKTQDFEALHQKIVADIARADWVDARTNLASARREFSDDYPAIEPEIEAAALAAAKALPASDTEGSQRAYELLALMQPDNDAYAAKVKIYADQQAAIRAKAEAVRLAPVKKLVKEVDKVEGVTYLQSRYRPKYLNTRSTVYLYIGTKEGYRPTLRMKVQYTASDWLFVQDMAVGMAGMKFAFIDGPFERDNNSTIWEWVDVEPNPLQIEMLRKMAEVDDVTLRFDGQQYHKDVTLSSKDKQALREVLDAWDALNGTN